MIKKSFKPAQRPKAAVARAKQIADRVPMDARALGNHRPRKAGRSQPMADLLDSSVRSVAHGDGIDCIKLWSRQVAKQKVDLAMAALSSYRSGMPYDAERSRAAFRHYIKEVPISAGAWAIAAGLSSRNTINAFLKGRSESISVPNIIALAEVIHVPPTVLMGLEPVSAEAVDRDQLVRVAERLILALAQSARDAPPLALPPPEPPEPKLGSARDRRGAASARKAGPAGQ